MKNNIIINLPSKIKITVWKKEINNYINIYVYNNTKKFELYINKNWNNFKYDKWSNTIEFNNNKKLEIIKISNFFNKFFKTWDSFFFTKIKFKGKGFRIKFLKKLKLVKFFFGKSHKTFIFFKKIRIKRVNKYKFILKNINKNLLNSNANIINKIKKLNFYTLRGLRKSRQIIYKRKGKKGTYI